MAKYEIRPLQMRLLDILMVIDKMCAEHKLRYYLVDGSLIGAVREGVDNQDFVPKELVFY